MFIQWKGTDVCADVWCPECGATSHIDGYFFYGFKCFACKSTFKVGQSVTLTKCNEDELGEFLEDNDDSYDNGLLSQLSS